MPCPICSGCDGPYPGPARSGITLQTEDAVRADKRYYLNADRSRVVEEGHPSAAYLLAAEGDDISNEDVKRYGLGKKQAPEPEPMVVHSTAADVQTEDDDKPETKAVEKAPANKARSAKDAEDK